MNTGEERLAQGAAMPRLIFGTPSAYFTPAGVSLASLEKADEIQNGAGRRTSAPVRKWFVRSLDGEIPMLSTLYSGAGRGGRSGFVSIKVLLSLLWKTSKPPFETIMTAPALAELLDLPDPKRKGARRVRDALQVLADANLINLVSRPGTSPLIQLMNETGNEEEYALPSTSYTLSQRTKSSTESVTDPNLYFLLPAELWTEGFFQTLKGPGLVMLLVLLSEQAYKRPVWFSGGEFKERYQISPSTRTKGTQELVDLGLLTRLSVPLPSTWGGSTFEQQRRRYVYRLTGVFDRLSAETPSSTATASSLSKKPNASGQRTKSKAKNPEQRDPRK